VVFCPGCCHQPGLKPFFAWAPGAGAKMGLLPRLGATTGAKACFFDFLFIWRQNMPTTVQILLKIKSKSNMLTKCVQNSNVYSNLKLVLCFEYSKYTNIYYLVKIQIKLD
jgi:hypothetical protein